MTVGTRDFEFAVSKEIAGKKISVEGKNPGKLISERKTIKKNYQNDIQLAATGIKVLD